MNNKELLKKLREDVGEFFDFIEIDPLSSDLIEARINKEHLKEVQTWVLMTRIFEGQDLLDDNEMPIEIYERIEHLQNFYK